MWESIIGKPFFKSWTMRGMLALATVRAAEAAGLVAPGTSVLTDGAADHVGTVLDAIGQAVNAVGSAAVVLGIRRAAAK